MPRKDAVPLPPTPAHPKPSGNVDGNVDGEGRYARDEPSDVEQTLPGAFPIPGPDGTRNTSRSDDEASENGPVVPLLAGEEKEVETGDGGPLVDRDSLRSTLDNNNDANIAMVLVEANLVTPSDNGDVPVVEGQAVVEKSATEQKRKRRRRLFLILGLALVVAGIAVGVTLGITFNRSPASLLPQSSPQSLSPSLSLSPSKSPAPSSAPTMRRNFRQLYESLPNHTTILLQNTRSPQYKAWGWLSLLDDTLNMELWKLRQRFALACFRFATTAFDSYIVDQFSPLDVDECQWDGVSCNQRGNLTQLAYSDLVGTVPRELYFLSDLSRLNLAFNLDLEGTLSSDLRLLSNLEVFNLSAIDLSGSIPTQLGRLSSLIRLDLYFTFINGILPTHLCQLPNLRRLNLEVNSLSGAIPTHLGNLSSSLRWLDLSDNAFTGALPSELGQLTLLKHLDLSWNYFTGALPPELGLLTQLEHLDVSYSASDSFPGFPTELGRLSQLTYLYLDIPGSITGSSPVSIPTEIFQLNRLESLGLNFVNGTVFTELGLLSQLKNLKLTVQSVTGRLPTELGQLTLLESLDIWCFENGTIPAEVGLMSRLTDLAMRGATGTIPTTLGQLTVLKTLALYDQSLMGSIPTELGQLSTLTSLDLNFKNALTGTIPIDFLGLLSNLRELSISNFNGIIPTELGLLSNNLQSLMLSDSYANGPIPTELGLLSELTHLTLWYKELTGTIPTELGHLTKLESMYLVDASVTGSVPSEICQLANISGGVLNAIAIDCDLVSCSCGVDVCNCI